MQTVIIGNGTTSFTPRLINHYANRTAAFRTKWVLFMLFGLGALALWAGSEAVLPAYIAGMLLSKNFARDQEFIRRLRTLTIGFLSPFYFLRAGSLVSIPALVAAPLVFLALFSGKIFTKIFGLVPVIGLFRSNHKERWYYTLFVESGRVVDHPGYALRSALEEIAGSGRARKAGTPRVGEASKKAWNHT